MKNNILLLLALAFTTGVWAQKTSGKKKSENALAKQTLTLNKKEDIISTVDLGSEGFILKTGVEYAGRDGKVRLHKYKTDLSKLWTVEIPKSTNTMLENFVLASPNSEYTYYIQSSKVTTKSAGKMIITRIDAKGKSTNYTLKVDPKGAQKGTKGKTSTWPIADNKTSYIAAFVDEESLYLLTSLETVSSDKEVKKKKVAKKNVKVVLFKLSHSSKAISSMDTDIELNDGEDDADLFVEYLGHDDEHIYVSRKSVNLSEKQITYNILTLNKSGEKVDETTIETSIEGLPVPSVNFRESYGSRIYNNDYDVQVSSHTVNGRTTYTYTYTANHGSFGCAQLDYANGKFYVYGLSLNKSTKKGKKEDKNSSNLIQEANSFYIYQYDFNTGNLLNSTEKPLPKDLLTDKGFVNPSVFYYRNLWLDVIGPEMVRLNGVFDNSLKLHSVCVDLSTQEIAYMGKEVPARRKAGVYHRVYLTNVLATKMEASKEYQQFLKATPDFRTKEYSVFALLLGNTRIVAKNYSLGKNPKIEFTAYPIHDETEGTEN